MNSTTPQAQDAVAIIGGGIAGISAAFALVRAGRQVTLFERADLLGGDTFAVEVHSWDGKKHWVDGGVSDFNQSTFHHFNRFLDEMGVEKKFIRRETGFMDENQRLIYFVTDTGKMTVWQAFPQQEALQEEVYRFRRDSIEVLAKDDFRDFSIEQYLQFRGYSEVFWNYYFKPRALACFLMHREPIEDFPIRSLVAFWQMHSIVGAAEPQRTCLVGGMIDYCFKFQNWFKEQGQELKLGTLVQRVEREESGVRIRYSEQGHSKQKEFSSVIFAVKPGDVLSLLQAPSNQEQAALGGIPFARDRIVVHTDHRLLPRSKRAWGAYNLTIGSADRSAVEPTITFWQNNLATLDSRLPDVFMTLNPTHEPDPHLIIEEKYLIHPVGSFAANKTTEHLSEIQGRNRTWYCGSYTEIPFLHENAFTSGLKAAEGILSGFQPKPLRE